MVAICNFLKMNSITKVLLTREIGFYVFYPYDFGIDFGLILTIKKLLQVGPIRPLENRDTTKRTQKTHRPKPESAPHQFSCIHVLQFNSICLNDKAVTVPNSTMKKTICLSPLQVKIWRMATQWVNPVETFQKSRLAQNGVLNVLRFSVIYDQISASIVLFLLYSSTSSEDYKAGDCITQKGCHANDKKDFPANYSYQFLRYTSVKIIITWSGAKDTRGVNQKESICETTWH